MLKKSRIVCPGEAKRFLLLAHCAGFGFVLILTLEMGPSSRQTVLGRE